MKWCNLADRMSRLGTESAFEVMAKAQKLEAQGKNIVHLEIGQPDFTTPENIIEAAYKAMKDGFTGYTPSQGLLQTREAIAAYCEKQKNIKTDASEIVVVPGGKPIMFYLMLALVNPGDEVIYPNPGFPIYESCINFVGGKPVPMPMLQENEFRVDIEGLKKLVSDKTKLIIINSPGNPTGGLLREDDIRKIAEVVRTTNAYVMSDEIYDRIIFSGEKPFSIASIPDMKDRTIILDGFSKTYAMTGWRLGYGVMNPDLAQQITRLVTNSASCAAAFSQVAAIEALTGPQDASERMCEAFHERCQYMADALNDIDGIDCLMPKGAFYMFPSIKGTGLDCREFANRLMEEGGVASLAGTDFGIYGEGHIRLSAANSLENIKIACERIKNFVAAVRK